MIDLALPLLNAMPLPVFIQDVDGRFTECNDRLLVYANLQKHAIIGKTVYEITGDKEFGDQSISLNKSLLLKGNETTGQYSWAGHSIANEYKNIIVNKGLLRDASGEVYGVIGTITDLTNSSLFSKELIKVENTFISNGINKEVLNQLNHEFRTPMNAIIGFTEVLYQEEVDENKKDFLESIILSSERLMNLIRNVFHLAEIESSDFDLKIERVNIKDFAIAHIESFRNQIESKGLSLTTNCSENLPDYVYTCKFAFSLFVSNLLSNAIKFSHKGSIKVRVYMRDAPHFIHSKKIVLEVEDEGIGIAKEKLNSIFNKYVKIHKENEAFFDGAGLGLNIIKQIVDVMDGNISVSSTENVGSLFTIEFPVSIK